LPEFYKGEIVVNAIEFAKWIDAHSGLMSKKGYFKFFIMESKKGKYYLAVDTTDFEGPKATEMYEESKNIPY